jgi:hypothetical protein
MRAASALVACSLAALWAAGCGDIDAGSAQFPGTILYQDADGGYEFRLLEPPWIPPFVVAYDNFKQTLSIVPPVDATVSSDPVVLLGQAIYSLQFSSVTGDPAAAMAQMRGTIPSGAITDPSSAVLTAEGSSGVEMTWQEEATVFHRDAFLAGSATPTFWLHFTAQKAIKGDPMVDQMVNSFRAK